VDLREIVLGTRDTIAGTVYGTIVVLSVLTAGAPAFEHGEWKLVVIGAVTVLVFWLAHVYSHILGESVRDGHRLGRREITSVARRELAIPLAAVLPMTAVALGAIGVLGNTLALWIAVGIGVATLTIEGIRYARLERLSRFGTVAAVGLNLAFGLILVVLKATLSH
jgi:hypothetical protein